MRADRVIPAGRKTYSCTSVEKVFPAAAAIGREAQE